MNNKLTFLSKKIVRLSIITMNSTCKCELENGNSAIENGNSAIENGNSAIERLKLSFGIEKERTNRLRLILDIEKEKTKQMQIYLDMEKERTRAEHWKLLSRQGTGHILGCKNKLSYMRMSKILQTTSNVPYPDARTQENDLLHIFMAPPPQNLGDSIQELDVGPNQEEQFSLGHTNSMLVSEHSETLHKNRNVTIPEVGMVTPIGTGLVDNVVDDADNVDNVDNIHPKKRYDDNEVKCFAHDSCSSMQQVELKTNTYIENTANMQNLVRTIIVTEFFKAFVNKNGKTIGVTNDDKFVVHIAMSEMFECVIVDLNALYTIFETKGRDVFIRQTIRDGDNHFCVTLNDNLRQQLVDFDDDYIWVNTIDLRMLFELFA